jgi:hypothetical protein
MKLFLLSTLSAFLLPAALPGQSPDAPVDPFEGGPPISLGQQAAAVADASYRDGKDQIAALNDGKEPKTSADASVPFFSFYPHEGSFEWVQYVFPSAMALEGCEVFWKRSAAAARRPGPDKGTGLPLFWKVLYQNAGGDWLPVDGVPPPPSVDRWNVCQFKPVMTKALRLAVQQASGSSVGFYEWKVIPARAKPVPAVSPAELRLDDLIPLSAKVGYGSYRVNQYSASEEAKGAHVLLEGQECSHFLFTHADSSVSFAIPGGYQRFTAMGIAPSIHPDPSWTYQILADGKPVYQSGELRTYPGYQVKVEVDLPLGSRTLTLVTGTAGNGYYDHSLWAGPKFLQSPANGKTAGKTTTSKQTPEPSRVSTFEIKSGSAGDQFLVAKKGKTLELNPKRGSTFRIVPGLSDSKLVSLELAGNRDCYVRHQNGVLWLHERPKNNANFDRDATFTMIRPDGDHARFEQGNWKGTFITVRHDGMIVLSEDVSKEKSTFLLVPK